MAYCTSNDLISRFSENEVLQLSDKEGTGQIDQAVLASAIKDASATIDGYLAGRVELPFSSVPEVLTRACAEITRYYLYDNGAPEHVVESYKNNVRYLEQVASGKISLGLSAEQTPQAGDEHIQVVSTGSVFGRNNGTNFI